MRKIEIGRLTIDVSPRRRGAAPPFATLELLETPPDAAMRNFKTNTISDANAARNGAEHNATLSIFLRAFAGVLSIDEAIGLISKGKRS